MGLFVLLKEIFSLEFFITLVALEFLQIVQLGHVMVSIANSVQLFITNPAVIFLRPLFFYPYCFYLECPVGVSCGYTDHHQGRGHP